jgi:hypothetical protein
MPGDPLGAKPQPTCDIGELSRAAVELRGQGIDAVRVENVHEPTIGGANAPRRLDVAFVDNAWACGSRLR